MSDYASVLGDLRRIDPVMVLRRLAYGALAIGTTALATSLMAQVMGANGLSSLGMGVLVLFALSFAWLAFSFWSSVLGFVVRLVGGDPSSLSVEKDRQLTQLTAVVMPIYNEDTDRVAAGIDATLDELKRTGQSAHFEVFILSDTTKDPIGARELQAVTELRERHPDGPVLHYRRREKNIGRKAGNIEDFVRRWGHRYAHMLVLDADSVMSGETMLRLAQLMEAHPQSGIIQTIPMPVNRETPFARILQFAARLYGPVSASGLAFWAGGEANYYGHNAIIRIEAFARHCGLPILPGAAPLGGQILSHDFVEAALIRRAGFKVWLVPELGGSFEEMPANVIDYATRDRRWSQGNMQHARLVSFPGLKFVSRMHLFMGVAAYVTSPLWLALLLLSTGDAMQRAVEGTVYFKPGFNLFPSWPVATDFQINLLLGLTLSALFVPKLLGLLLVIFSKSRRRLYGGFVPLVSSVLLETAFTTLLAPVMMLFQTLFVATTLLGRTVAWEAQPRDDRGLTWKEGFLRHAGQTAFGLAWGVAVLFVAPDFFWWLTPVLAGLAVAIPLSVLSSRLEWGLRLKRWGLFLTPDETRPPVALRRLRRAIHRGGYTDQETIPVAGPALVPEEDGLVMGHTEWRETAPAAMPAPQPGK